MTFSSSNPYLAVNFNFLLDALDHDTLIAAFKYVLNNQYISTHSMFVYKIPYRRARAWPSRVRRASKGTLHTT